MKIQEVRFDKSVSIQDTELFFDARKEIIFVGRSNVGKSSLMNAIFHKKDLVKTSSRPGKTKTANLFLVNNKFYYTDLPGYGFAKLGKELKEHLDALISWYVEERKPYIKQVVILIDSKIWPQETDRDMYEYLLRLEMPVVFVLSKVDRLSKWERQKSREFTKDIFFWQQIFEVSSMKGVWVKELQRFLGESLK